MVRKIKNKLILLMLLFAITLVMPIRVFAIDSGKLSNKEVSKDKIWMIRFNIKLDSNTINNSVIVKDLSGNKINVNLKLSEDGKTIWVYPPVNNYETNKEYTLYVENNIKSISGSKLKLGATLNFFVRSNNSSSGNNGASSINAIAKVEVSPVMENFKVITIKNINNSNVKKFKIEGNNNLFDISKSAFSIINDNKVTIYFYGEDENKLIGKGTLDVSKTSDNLDIKIQ